MPLIETWKPADMKQEKGEELSCLKDQGEVVGLQDSRQYKSRGVVVPGETQTSSSKLLNGQN